MYHQRATSTSFTAAGGGSGGGPPPRTPSIFDSKPPAAPSSTTGAGATSSTATTTTAGSTTSTSTKRASIDEKDYIVPHAGQDGTSCLSWSPSIQQHDGNNNHCSFLLSGNWDNGVRCWAVEKQQGGPGLRVNPAVQVNHENAVLAACWSPDASTFFSGGCDKVIRSWQPGHQPATANALGTRIGAHDAPVSKIGFLNAHGGLVISGSWDGTIKFWDGRSDQPVQTLPLSGKVHAMDVHDKLLVCATSDQKIVSYDFSGSSGQPFEIPNIKNPHKHQIRSISCLPDSTGFVVGSIGGRAAIVDYNDPPTTDNAPKPQGLKSFAFRCHREKVRGQKNDSAYAINDISFFDTHKFATAGSDGTIFLWNKQERKRIKLFPATSRPISCAQFNADGTFLAYASCDDWSKGSMHNTPGNEVFIHSMAPSSSSSP